MLCFSAMIAAMKVRREIREFNAFTLTTEGAKTHWMKHYHTMMQVCSVSLLERMTFIELFSNPELTDNMELNANQLGLFDF